jgi:hypothetical protein
MHRKLSVDVVSEITPRCTSGDNELENAAVLHAAATPISATASCPQTGGTPHVRMMSGIRLITDTNSSVAFDPDA